MAEDAIDAQTPILVAPAALSLLGDKQVKITPFGQKTIVEFHNSTLVLPLLDPTDATSLLLLLQIVYYAGVNRAMEEARQAVIQTFERNVGK
jgi:hypothetical protein